MIQIYPSLISSNLLNLGDTLAQLNSHVAGYHIDIMDGHFVPNLTWGPAFVEALASATSLPLHIHCMVNNPIEVVQWLSPRPQDLVIVHIESSSDIQKICAEIVQRGCRVGLAVNPNTQIQDVFKYLGSIDHVLLMSVNPGFSGQQFIDSVVSKIDILAQEIEDKKIACSIGIDGGITVTNIHTVVTRGVTCVAAASAIFSSVDPVGAVQDLYAAANSATV